MSKNFAKIIDEIHKIGIIPVAKLDDEKNAVSLCDALIKGGINTIEVTFRTACAAQSIKNIAKAFPDMLVGAGTVLTVEQVKSAVDAGAKFVVSPGLNKNVVSYCLDNDICIIPGCITPTEIEQAIELGLDTVKFFPAEAAGGLPMIKALSAPYGNIKFMPTGGIGLDNLADYIKCKMIIACGGSFMITDNLEQVELLSKQAIQVVASARNN